MTKRVPTPEEVAAVSSRCEQTYHSITALHDLCNQAISDNSGDPVTLFVVFRENLRGIARDMEICSETLAGDIGANGFFQSHYGSV